jgi:outer membrane protein insertion porin family
MVNAGLTQHNFRGMGQELRLTGSISYYSKSIDLGFTEPYLFDTNIALGADVFRRDYNSYNTLGDTSSSTYDETTTGFQVRAGVPLSEYWSAQVRYQLSRDDVSLDPGTYYTNGVCDPTLAGEYLCAAVGDRTTSSIGYSLVYDTRNNRLRPTSGEIVTVSQDYAGLGGSVRYLRSTLNASKYWNLGSGFTLMAHAEGGYIWGIGQDVLLTDRFFLGEPEMAGFDIRGVGPRVTNYPYNTGVIPATLTTTGDSVVQNPIGGDTYYHGRLELQVPVGSGLREMGLRPSIFMDVGAVFGVPTPVVSDYCAASNKANVACNPPTRQYTDGNGHPLYLNPDGTTTTTNNGVPYNYQPQVYQEVFYGDTPRPRVAIGVGINWNSPFGPLRIDVAKALITAPGDDTKLITFNVGTQF